MRDLLRRQALESKKTVSKKAQSRGVSRPSSRTTSAHSSRPSSRNASRHPSDDEENGSQSDDTTSYSATSFDDFTGGNDEELGPEDNRALEEVIKELTDRKRSSVQGREEYLRTFVRILTTHYMADGLEGNVQELLQAFAKSIKSESSEKETIFALRAVGLTAVTTMDESIYPSMFPVIKRTIMDSASYPTKAAAIHCLGACAAFGGAGGDGIASQMEFFMEIAASDGNYVDADDDPATVTAALEEWGFLATELEDLEEDSEEAIETFADQLESSETSVQIAAGENIALLYEKSYTPLEEGEEEEEEEDTYASDDDRSSSLSDDEDGNGEKLIKRYNAYHNTPRVIKQIESLAHISGRHINKKDKRSLHTNFTSILNTVINPRHGPQYNNAIDNETDRQYGSRKKIKFHRNSYIRVDRWWKWLRFAAMRRLLQGGFVAHYFEGNRAILDSLPIMMGQLGDPGSSKSKNAKGKKGGRRKVVESF